MSGIFETALAASGYFRGLSPQGVRTLAGVCAQAAVKKRDCLFHEGARGRAVFLLLSGAVQLVKTAEDGRQVVIRTVPPGEVFGEAILFERDTYPVTAVAVRESRLCAIPRTEFLRLLRDEAFRADFIRGLTDRMRYLADRILYLTARDVEERFFAFLAEQHGRQEEYRLSLSKKDIAAAIGATPETLSRLRERLLRRKTLLRWDARGLRLRPGFWG
jgi:CRP/FNR family transcriptional regulator